MISQENDEEDGIVLFGHADYDKNQLIIKRSDEPPFPIPEHTLDRIKPVTDDLRSILKDADFWITLYVVPKPENASPDEYVSTGFTWPSK